MKKFLRFFIFFLIFLLSSYGLVIAFFPSVHLNRLYQVAITDHQGNELYSLIRSNFSDYVPIDEVSEEFKKTVVTIEDKRFYSHNGLDYARIAKSFWENFRQSEIVQGGSTITQQVARMAYLDNSKSYSRKIKEALYAKKIEEKYTKDQILEMYVNNCYFAHNLYGVSAASAYYFGKTPAQLNYGESALLVGIINAPNLYAPDIDYAASIEKQRQILYTLYQNRVLNVQEYYDEMNRKLDLLYRTDAEKINLGYYQEAVENQLKAMNLWTDHYLRQGIQVESNLDLGVYETVNAVVGQYRNQVRDDQIAAVVMKPYSGEVLALIGGFDYRESPYNRALYSKRQIGSTIKPLLYYLGLKKGMTPLSQFVSEETTFNIEGIGTYSPKNASGNYAGRKINMIEAIALSDNIYAVKTTLLVGSSSLAQLLNRFGVECDNVNPTIGLGSISLTPLELTSIYNCLASEGTYYAPSFLKKVRLSDQTLLGRVSESSKKILDHKETILINHLLKSPFDPALASYTYPSLGNYRTSHTFAAKTGSTETTNWVIGYNPHFTIGVYVGNDENQALFSTKLARKVFQEIADRLCEKKEDIFYEVDSSFQPFRFYNSLLDKTSDTYYR